MNRQRICLVDTGGGSWLGGSYYIQNIIGALEQLPEDRRASFELFCLTEQAGPFPTDGLCQWVTADSPRHSLADKVKRRLAIKSGISHPIMHEELKRVRPDFAYPCATGSASRVGYRSAHWVADFQTKLLPQFSPAAYRLSSDRYIDGIMRDAQQVVLSSHASEADCHQLFPRSVDKTFVMPFRAASLLSELAGEPLNVAPKYHIPEKYVIVCNQFWAHKNHLKLFEAVAQLKSRGVNIHLVCTGRLNDARDPAFSDTLLQAIARHGIASSLSLLGALPRAEMLGLVRRSLALVQPSLFEGWNTSVEEAHCLGLPVVLSDIPVHREQAPAKARFFDPHSAEQLAEALLAVWEGEAPSWQPEREAAAVKEYLALIRTFGERFIDLALCSK